MAYEYSGYFLGNSGDEVVILDGAVEVTRMTYTAAMEQSGRSLALCNVTDDPTDQDRWLLSTTPYGLGDTGTPAAANDVMCIDPPDLDPGDLIVTEVMPNPTAVFDSRGEWLELFNATCQTINLRGLKLVYDDFDAHIIADDVFVGPGSYVVLGNNDDPSQNGGVPVEYEYSGYFLGNSGDEVVVTGLGGLEITRMTYTRDMEQPGESLALRCLVDDPAAQANWFGSMTPYGLGDLGTPGAENDIEPNCPPITGTVCLDVKPGSDTDPINVRSRGVIPVAILGSCIDVTEIDPGTVTFGPGAAAPAHRVGIHFDDVDGDQLLDAVFHFRTQETGLAGGDVDACIEWLDWAGAPFRCCDAIRAFDPLMDEPTMAGPGAVRQRREGGPSTGFGCGGTIAPLGLGDILGNLLPLLLIPVGLLAARMRRRTTAVALG